MENVKKKSATTSSEPYYKLRIYYTDGTHGDWMSRDRANKTSKLKNREIGLKRLKKYIEKQINANNCLTAVIYDRQNGKEIYKWAYGSTRLDLT